MDLKRHMNLLTILCTWSLKYLSANMESGGARPLCVRACRGRKVPIPKVSPWNFASSRSHIGPSMQISPCLRASKGTHTRKKLECRPVLGPDHRTGAGPCHPILPPSTIAAHLPSLLACQLALGSSTEHGIRLVTFPHLFRIGTHSRTKTRNPFSVKPLRRYGGIFQPSADLSRPHDYVCIKIEPRNYHSCSLAP